MTADSLGTAAGFTVGIDLIEPERIQHAAERWGDAFLDRVFTADERVYCDRMANPWLHYAARFAAKEAFSKALGSGMRGLAWRDVAVVREGSGRPTLHVRWPEGHAPREASVSLSHTRTMAAAIVLLGPAPVRAIAAAERKE
ncbi:MAG: holo-ACP synthase [bacterium]